jgi:hypothetical protein
MRVYHVTDCEAAASIEASGFRDSTGHYLTDQEWSGVWVSNRPLNDRSGIPEAVAFEIEIDHAAIADLEWVEDGRDYREWLIPARVLNAAPRRRIEL